MRLPPNLNYLVACDPVWRLYPFMCYGICNYSNSIVNKCNFENSENVQFITQKILFHLQPKLKNIGEKLTEIQNEHVLRLFILMFQNLLSHHFCVN